MYVSGEEGRVRGRTGGVCGGGVWSMCWGGAKILIAMINDFPAFFRSLSPVA